MDNVVKATMFFKSGEKSEVFYGTLGFEHPRKVFRDKGKVTAVIVDTDGTRTGWIYDGCVYYFDGDQWCKYEPAPIDEKNIRPDNFHKSEPVPAPEVANLVPFAR